MQHCQVLGVQVAFGQKNPVLTVSKACFRVCPSDRCFACWRHRAASISQMVAHVVLRVCCVVGLVLVSLVAGQRRKKGKGKELCYFVQVVLQETRESGCVGVDTAWQKGGLCLRSVTAWLQIKFAAGREKGCSSKCKN